MTKITQSILATVSYSDVFEYPLTREEIWKYYIGVPASYQLFDRELDRLLTRKKLIAHSNYFVLPNRKHLIGERNERKEVAQQKLPIARKAARLLAVVPSVWFVGISGALAMHNAPYDDDIDLFIITAPGTLWFTRMLITVWLDALKWRRRPDAVVVKDKVCLNMLLSADRLQLPKKQQDLYAAHELAQLVPLVNKKNTYEQLLAHNQWVRNFLPHCKSFQIDRNYLQPPAPLLVWIETVCYRWQLWYMRLRRTRELVNRQLLQFHPVDARLWVKEAYVTRLRQLKIPLAQAMV